MADPDKNAPLALNDPQTELRMRRALGLGDRSNPHGPQQRPDQARQRHRFVQDGGVPVTMLNARTDPDTAALRDQIQSLQSALDDKATQLVAARKTIADQEKSIQALQTRIAHNDLAHADALETERRALAAAQEALAAAPATRAAPKAVAVEIGEKKKRGRPRIHPIQEPKPIRWWTPSFKAKIKA